MRAQAGLFSEIYNGGLKFDYTLFLDTDIAPVVNVIDLLMATEKDVVTAPIWCFDDAHKDIHLNVHYTFENTQQDRVYTPKETGVEHIESASFSCLLVARKVFETFYNAKEDPILWSPILDPKWKEHENDIIFFKKLKHFGIDAYVCWDAAGGIHNRRTMLCDETINRLLAKRMKCYIETALEKR